MDPPEKDLSSLCEDLGLSGGREEDPESLMEPPELFAGDRPIERRLSEASIVRGIGERSPNLPLPHPSALDRSNDDDEIQDYLTDEASSASKPLLLSRPSPVRGSS